MPASGPTSMPCSACMLRWTGGCTEMCVCACVHTYGGALGAFMCVHTQNATHLDSGRRTPEEGLALMSTTRLHRVVTCR